MEIFSFYTFMWSCGVLLVYSLGALLLYFFYVLMALVFRHEVAISIVMVMWALFQIGLFFYKTELLFWSSCSILGCMFLAKRTETIRIKDEEKQKCDESIKNIAESAINSERDFRKTQQKAPNNIENSLQMIA